MGIFLVIGSIITTIVTNVKSLLSNAAKTTANGFKAIAKEIAKIIPGMIGAIASFIFNAAGEAVGFLAKNAWLLILFVVTFVIERYYSKK